ncbi:MAG: hypothetical protein JWM21_1248 [Acidobacteria bacterium]|nr:hypothetical protein [Acidobacteriota bacterium]
MDRFAEVLDNVIFLKKGYSVLAHLLPFGVASLLLIILSVPQDNLLLKLVLSLERPGIWLPAALLSTIAASVYTVSVYVQVRKAYLFPCRGKMRVTGTCLFFMLLCTLMAYVVLKSASPKAFTPAGIWACFLVAALSLTGIGWSTPTTWIDALGIKHPDYKEAQRVVRLLTDELKLVRAKPRARKADVTRILDYAETLRTELEKNVDCEPGWAKQRISQARDGLAVFVAEVTARFSNADDQVIEDFAQVMNCRKRSQYGNVVNALTALAGSWPEWRCSQ